MKKRILVLLSSICLTILCFLGINSKTKTIIANAIDNYQNPQYNYGESVTSFDHIDIRSAASFTYYVDGKPVTVNINFYEDNANLSKINIYKKNQNGTLTEIPVTGKWQNVSGGFGNNSSTNKEYRISGNFARYYNNTQTEVVYIVKFTLSVTIGGVAQELVYTENYSYSSSNNVCPGKIDSDNRGIDVQITGTKLEEYFSSSLKIIKNVLNAENNTFTFNVKAVNNNIDFNKDIQITTTNNTGFITLGGLKAGEQYIIKEINIPEGYELVTEQPITITAEKNKTIEVIFTNRAKTINVTGTKTWSDNNNQDGIRPDSITVNLLKNGTKIASTEVTSEDNWEYSFNNLPEYENGEKITYTITEEVVTGYETTINGYNITNTHTPEKVNITGTKTWSDNNNQDGIRPDSITVNLLKNGTKITSKEVTAEANWTYTFDNLPKNENGQEITYTVAEETVEGYVTTINGYNITNTHIPETTIVMGKKIWNDNNNQDGIRPDSITVRLYANNQEVKSAVITKGENNDWTYAFTNLPKYQNGQVIIYTITEDKVAEYITTYDEENPYIIINTHQTKTIDINGTKTWEDNNNQDGFRPESITIRLNADGEEIESKVVTADNDWNYSFTNLDMYKDGNLISYTITEDAVKNYSTTINGYDIINTHTPEKISVSGTKTWTDNDNQDGIRPDSITINLLKNGEKITSKEVTSETNWTYTFENLDKYENGTEIEYILTEEIVEGYETNINGYDITNTHEIEKITFQATKIWEDNDNQDGIRQTEITVKLYKNGELFQSVKITEENNWTYEFKDLDRYENGEEIIYTIEEDIVLGYDTEINYDEIDENNVISVVITNTHIPEETTIEINKIWNDYDNATLSRPNNIEVDLYANGEYLKTVVITDQNNWKYAITQLPKYINGEEITYTISEKEVEGYTTTYDEFNIINTIEIGKGGDVEVLPPQTGVNDTTANYSYNQLTIILAGLFLLIKKFI